MHKPLHSTDMSGELYNDASSLDHDASSLGPGEYDMTDWQKQRSERNARLDAGSRYASGKMVPPESAKALLEAVIRPGDRSASRATIRSRPIFSPRSWQV